MERSPYTYAQCLPDPRLADAVSKAVNGSYTAASRVLPADVNRVTVLDLRGRGITGTAGLGMFTRLVHLSLSGNELTTVEGLEGLSSLRALNLACNRIETFDGACCPSGLTQLAIKGNRIRRIIGAERLPSMISFTAFDQHVEPPALASAPDDGVVTVGAPIGPDGRAIEPTTISGNGVFDSDSGTIIWTGVTSDAELTAEFHARVAIGRTRRGSFGGTIVQRVGNPTVSVTVRFDSKGGGMVVPVVVERGGRIARPADPVKDGYMFLGWSAVDGYATTTDSLFDFERTPIDRGMTLYALWRPD